MGMIGNTPYQGLIDTGNIVDGAITAAKLKAAADLISKLGYTPVNKAGDSMSGIHRHNSYLSIGKGPANNDQITWNAVPDNAGNYTPQWTGANNAGGTIVGMPSGGNGGLEIRTLRFGTNANAQAQSAYPIRFALTDDGMVTVPYQPAVTLNGVGGTVSIPTGVLGSSYLSLAEYWGPANYWNGSRFTAPVAGRYYVALSGNGWVDSSTMAIQIRKNGTTTVGYVYQQVTSGNWANCSAYAQFTLAANDWIEIVNNNGNLRLDSGRWFTVSIGLLS